MPSSRAGSRSSSQRSNSITASLPELTSASRVKKNFSIVLQRVRLDPGAQPLPHDLQQVDEHLAAQQLVDLLLARRVRAHQPRQRRRLVGRVVVDVHVRERAPALADEVDELLERAPLTVAVVAPRTARYVTDSVRLPPEHAEQELEPRGRVEERVALHVEEHVARRRRRQEPEPAPILRRAAGGT